MSFDKLLHLEEISLPSVVIPTDNQPRPRFFRAHLDNDWDRGDSIAQGGVLASISLKALVSACSPDHSRPISCQVQYLDQTLMGRDLIFGMQVLRKGKRFSFCQGVASQGGRSVLAIAGTCSVEDLSEEDLCDVGEANFTSLPLNFKVPQLSECTFYDSLMGYQNEDNRGSKFSRKVERDPSLGGIVGRERKAGMWGKFKRVLGPESWKQFQQAKNAPKDKDYWRRFANVDTIGYGSIDGRPNDIYSAAFFTDNFPPLSLWSFYHYSQDLQEMPQRAPGWTTLSLSMVFLRPPPPDAALLLSSNLEIASQQGRSIMEISVWSDPGKDEGRNLICVGRQVALLHDNTDAKRKDRLQKREERRDELSKL